jgi:CrcB protein
MRRDRMRRSAAVFAGGAAGALLRALLVEATAADGGWPWTTLAVNVAGAFALGYIAVRLMHHPSPWAYAHPLLATGFCGALTTFSAIQLEVLALVDGGRAATAAAYVACSVALGLGAVWLAMAITPRPARAT